MATTYIYGLCPPGSNEVMYVGKSVEPETRYDDHLKSAERGESSPKYDWIRELSKDDDKPEMVILDEDEGDGQELEIKWIVKQSALNKSLLNVIGNPLRDGHKKSVAKPHRGCTVFAIRMSPNDMRLLDLVTKSMGIPSKGSVLKMLLHSKAKEMGIDTGANEAEAEVSA